MSIRGRAVLALPAFALPLFLVPATAPGQAPLQAPYPIEALQRLPSEATGSTTFVVGLGRAPDPGHPEAGTGAPTGDELEWVTVLATEGWTHAYRSSVERRCEFLCGPGEGEECHWVGVFATPTAVPPIGEFLAVLPGRLDLADYRPLAELESAGPPPADPQAFLSAGPEARPLLWSRSSNWVAEYRVDEWNATTGELAITIIQRDGSENPVVTSGCGPSDVEWLRVIDCDGMSVLASGGRPLLISWPDYNASKIKVLARFDYGGSRHYIVRYGSKAQDVVGLVSGEPAGWRARLRERDWAQIC